MTGNCAVFFLWSACDEKGAVAGSIPEWITAIVTALALAAAMFAGVQAKKSADSARTALLTDIKVRDEAQARLVYSEAPSAKPVQQNRIIWERQKQPSEPGISWDPELVTPRTLGEKDLIATWFRKVTKDAVEATVVVRNLSPEIITDVYLYFVNLHLRDPIESISVQGQVGEVITPKGEASHAVVIPYRSSVELHEDQAVQDFMLGWERVVEFRDSSGVWWRRRGVEPIQKLKRTGKRPPDVIDLASFEAGT